MTKADKADGLAEALARRRAELIIQVQAGQLTAVGAAAQLGMSRKTYYKWEQRVLAAILASVQEGKRGRPVPPRDPEKERLRVEVETLREQVRVQDQLQRVRALMRAPLPDESSLSATKKKVERDTMILEGIEELKAATGWPYERLCRQTGVPHACLMRWKARCGRGHPPVTSPGPHKLEALNLAALMADLQRLSHGSHRTAGTGELYEQYRGQLSRMNLRALVAEARRACWQQRELGRQRVHWHAPRLIWAVDDVHIGYTVNGRLYCNHIQDLSSRYKMPPALTEGHVMAGEQVAQRLDSLFEVYGPPLVVKRDNGSNLDCQAVDEVLGRHWVVPLNSPLHYPPYNGGIEKAQRDYKEALAQMGDGDHLPMAERLIRSQLAICKLNDVFRRCLHGHSAYWSFETGITRQKEYTRRQRKEVFAEMIVLAKVALTEPDGKKPLSPAAAWRLAVQTWLQFHGMITIATERKVLPIFP